MSSELFQHVAMMSRLQVDMSNIFMPAPISPTSTLPNTLAQEAHGSVEAPFIGQHEDQEGGMDFSEYNREHDRYVER